MKAHTLALWVLALALTGPAQGTIYFANVGTGLNAPVYMYDGVTKVSSAFTVELLAGPELNNIRSVATASFFSSAPGYFNGGTVIVSNVAPRATAWCVVQVWLTQTGSFSNAFASLQFCGACAPFKLVLGGAGTPPSPPAVLTGITTMGPVGGLAVFEEPLATLHPQASKTNTLFLIWGNYPVTGWRYSLQQSPDLELNRWFAVTNPPELNASSLQVTIPAPRTNAYYRLRRDL